MESQELIFNTVDTLKYPITLIEIQEEEYIVSYMNQSMQNILTPEESSEAKLPNTFLELLDSCKDEVAVDGVTLKNVEFFDKFYNVNVIKNSDYFFVTFIEISINKLFESISFHDMGTACSTLIVVLNDRGELVETNECFLNFVGMEKEAVANKNFFENFIPGSTAQLNQHLEKLMSTDSGHNHFVTSLKNVNDEVYRINWQVSKTVKHNKNFVIAVGSDISTLYEQNSNFKQELDSIKVGFKYFPFAVGYMDYQGNFTSLNKKFVKMFHIKDETAKINIEKIPFFKKYIEFDKMAENIKLIKELNYKIKYPTKDKVLNINVDIRMLSGKSESSKLYIVVAQEIKS